MEEKDFSTYPEGFKEIAAMFTMLPEERREPMAEMFMTMLLTL